MNQTNVPSGAALALRLAAVVTGGALLTGLGACAKDEGSTLEAAAAAQAGAGARRAPGASTAPVAPGATAPTMAPHEAPGGAGAPTIAGKVVETMNAGGYTYAKIDSSGTQLWVAGPETALTVGQAVTGVGPMAMPGFHSNALDRTFDQLYFISSYGGGAAGSADPHAGMAGAMGGDPHAGIAAPDAKAAPAPTTAIAPPRGGLAIADVFAQRDALTGKPVVVRGRALKVNEGILDLTWIHLQDGTGAAGTNDLLVTTTATGTVKVGDIVTARGTLARNRDFGAGYTYDVLLERATVTP